MRSEWADKHQKLLERMNTGFGESNARHDRTDAELYRCLSKGRSAPSSGRVHACRQSARFLFVCRLDLRAKIEELLGLYEARDSERAPASPTASTAIMACLGTPLPAAESDVPAW
eukprot:scaffold94265_cov54-Phaeocystis_antarctica.AAC.1